MSPSTAGLRLYKFATFLIRHLYDLMNRDYALTAVFHSEVMPVLFLAMILLMVQCRFLLMLMFISLFLFMFLPLPMHQSSTPISILGFRSSGRWHPVFSLASF